MRRTLICSLFLLLSACASPPGVVIVTEGFHIKLPAPGTTVQFNPEGPPRPIMNHASSIADINDRAAHQAAVLWLVKHGLVPIASPGQRFGLREEQRFRLQRDADPIQVGRMPGAMLRIDIDITGTHFGYSDWDTDGPTLVVQATDVETGMIVWSGAAHYVRTQRREFNWWVLCLLCNDTRYFVTNRAHLTRNISDLVACHALETAWGRLEPGTYPIEDNRCD